MLLMNWVNYIFVHQDARYAQNHELRIEVNVLIIRATSCTLRGVKILLYAEFGLSALFIISRGFFSVHRLSYLAPYA